MKKILTPLSIVCFCLFTFKSKAQYQWPFPTPNQQAAVAGSVGEYRYTASSNTHRFHKGVDLTNGGALDIHAINAGTVQWNNSTGTTSTVTVTSSNGQSFRYIHVNPSSAIASGQTTTVAVGDYLGDMVVSPGWATHLHLEEETTNFLDHNLNPYVDNTPPYFETTTLSNAVAFYQNGLLKSTTNHTNLLLNQQVTIDNAQYTMLYNKIDIAVHAKDPRVSSNGGNGGGQMLPSVIAWHAVDWSGQNVVSDELRFEGIPVNAAALPCFHPQCVHPANPTIHIVTSHPRTAPYDRFWNSRLRKGQRETWAINNRPATLDARFNLEAAYPDGKYSMRINAWDVDYNDDPNQSAAERSINFVLDNFRPYVKDIIVSQNSQNGNLVYYGYWQWSNTTNQLELGQITKSDAGPQDQIYIQITISEPAQNVRVNIPSVDGSTYTNATVVANTNNTRFVLVHAPITAAATQTLNIQAEDLAGNPLQTDPSLIPIRQADGTWSTGVVGGTDSNHEFKTGSFVCTNGSSGGRTASNARSSACLYADVSVNKSNSDINEPVTFTPLVSGSGALTYAWNFGSGAYPATSTSPGPQTVVYSTNGSRTITLQICDGSGSCTTATKTDIINVGLPPAELSVDFSADRLGGMTGDNIQLTSTVTGAVGDVTYSWNFGEGLAIGGYSNANPLISYNTPGNKTIQLTVTDANGSVTKVKNNYLVINSLAYNIGVNITGCGPSDNFGRITLGSFVNGGNGPPYDSYFWDFGDGTTLSTSSSSSVSHTYKKYGKYTVRLTVCDETSCGIGEQLSCVSVPWIVESGTLTPSFLVNDMPVTGPIQEVGLNTPVKFVSSTSGGGNPNLFIYNWKFDYQIASGSNGNSATPNLASSRGAKAQEVVYTTTGNKAVILTADNGTIARATSPQEVVKVVPGRGSGTCYATIGDVTISSTCWDAANLPKFTVPIATKNCTVAKTEVIYWITPGQGVVLPNGVLDFNAVGVTPQFPFTSDFSFSAYQFDGVSYNRIGYKRQRFTIYGSVVSDAGSDKQVCLNSSVQLGGASDDGKQYTWSSVTAPVSLLNNTSIANPVFTGIEKGTFKYIVTTSSKASGCSKSDEVIINVDLPSVADKTSYAGISIPLTLQPQVSGGFGDYTYLWSPVEKLSSATAATPVFNSPSEGNLNYFLTVTDARGCKHTGQMQVNVSSTPASLSAVAASYERIVLAWVDRSTNEGSFLIQRSVNGGSFENLISVSANVQSFDDEDIDKDASYTYRVAASISGTLTSFSNESTASAGLLPQFTTTVAAGPVYADFDKDGDMDSFNAGLFYLNENGVFSLSQTLTVPGYISRQEPADFDNDGDVDIWVNSHVGQSKLLVNNNAFFTSIDLPASQVDDINYFDYDGDNDVDAFIVSGNGSTSLLINNGNTNFSSSPIDIPNIINYQSTGLVNFADMDLDGDDDLIIMADDEIANKDFLRIYYNNNGFNTSEFTNVFSQCCSFGGLDVGDYNNDGKYDLIMSGSGRGVHIATFIFRNNGDFTFTNVNASLPGSYYNVFPRFGDYNGDGRTDIAFNSTDDDGPTLRNIYENMGTVFSLKHAESLGGTQELYHKWLDVDSDGDLDLIGTRGSIWRNNFKSNRHLKNSAPLAPDNLCVYFNGNQATFSWDRVDDAASGSALTYNLYVKQNGVFIMSPLADLNTGYRKIQKRGNVMHNASWTITLPGNGNIEWGVQAIDNSYAGSAFTHSTYQPDKSVCGPVTASTFLQARDITTPFNCSPLSVIVSNGAVLTLEAANSIKLVPGFKVLPGSYLKASLTDFNVGNSPCIESGGGPLIENLTDNDVQASSLETVSVFPNPTRGVIHVSASFGDARDIVRLEVINMNGTIIHSETIASVHLLNRTIDMQHAGPGIYLLRVVLGTKVFIRKVVKL